ncbi:hypothetical protein KM427_23155 [Nocardioides sp. LMS-CY]|uniref:hypothetical protein n=1 Tax=Nocardioides sp. (strain LMS-CY) TaxID=2840457 RepID=UPI001C008ECF|nr:hypothetical protein [Nocardioides sp. LMS-CY]QWF21788.1 hypothetical protein KM427_23155 [Nocardioides sp. LMS-CY]
MTTAASTRTTTAKKARQQRVPVTNAVVIALTQAADEAVAWWDEYDTLDDLDLGNDLEDVLASARRRGLETVEDLRREAGKVITDVTGIASITTFTTASGANALHRAKNTIAAIVFAAQVRHGDDPQSPYDLVETLPTVAPRHGSKRRPLHDDEVLLTRSSAVHSLHRGGRYLLVANQYALAESGAYPMETTSIEPVDFDSVIAPTTVLLPGVNTWSTQRRARLTRFAARLLAECLDRHLAAGGSAATWRLCYRGEGGKGAASASSSNNLKNLTIRIGITQPALEGSAATRWRIRKELKDRGDIAALRLMGKVKNKKNGPYYDISKVYDFLNLPPESSPALGEDDYDDDFTDF